MAVEDLVLVLVTLVHVEPAEKSSFTLLGLVILLSKLFDKIFMGKFDIGHITSFAVVLVIGVDLIIRRWCPRSPPRGAVVTCRGGIRHCQERNEKHELHGIKLLLSVEIIKWNRSDEYE